MEKQGSSLKSYAYTSFQVAGVTFSNRQFCLRALRRSRKENKIALIREPQNKHDANAIKVIAISLPERHTKMLGYVPKDLAAQLAPLMDDCVFIRVCDWNVVGNQECNYGLQVAIQQPIPAK